jgi:hypothetical protein
MEKMENNYSLEEYFQNQQLLKYSIVPEIILNNTKYVYTPNKIKEIIEESEYLIIFTTDNPKVWNVYKNNNNINIKRVFISDKEGIWNGSIILFLESFRDIYKIKNYFIKNQNTTKIIPINALNESIFNLLVAESTHPLLAVAIIFIV